MDGEQRFGGPGRPPAGAGGRGAPFPGGDSAATQAYPGPLAGGPGPDAQATQAFPPAGGYPPAAGGPRYGQSGGSAGYGGQNPAGQYGGQNPAGQYGGQYGGQYAAGQPDGGRYGAARGEDRYGSGQYGQDGGRGLFDPASGGPGRYGPGEEGPYGGDGDGPGQGGSGGPSRRVVLISLGAAVLLAVAVGAVYVATRPDTTTTAAPTPSLTATTSTASTPSSTPSATATVTVTATPTATATVAGTAPTSYVSDPTTWPGMDFGTVVAVKKSGAGATITVKRQQFLAGAAAQEYYASHPDEEALDYKILDLGRTRTFVLTPDALVYGQYLLGNQNEVTTTQLTVPQFVVKAKALQSKSVPLLVWMYHRSTPNGPVVYLAEQYTP